ncbi:MAG: hypothetical protein KME13_24185 [Myxacorys californica WJT36-NPBG1]|jgi:hypothetical protein|nr:hypothetical protein [Myxacorys californica WJT36-NPBG1]
MNFLTIVNGLIQRVATIAISTGSADADKIAATNGNGQLDNSFINWASPGAIGATTASTGRFTTLNGANTTDTTAFLVSQFNGLRTLSLGSTGVTTNTNLTVSAATASGSLGVGAIITQGGISAAKELRAGAGIFGVTATITASASVSDIQQWRDTLNGIVASIHIDGSFKKLRSAISYNAADATGTLGFFLGYNGDSSDNGLVKSFRTFLSRPASGSAVLSLDSWAGFDGTTPTAIPSSSWVSRLAFAGASFVGINTNTPGAALQVFGGLAVSSSSTAVSDPGAGNLSIAGTLKIGGGSTISRTLLAVSAALDTVSINPQSSTTITVTVTGAAVGDQVNVNPSSATPNTNIDVYGYVSAANTVTVVAYNRHTTTALAFVGNVRVSVVG